MRLVSAGWYPQPSNLERELVRVALSGEAGSISWLYRSVVRVWVCENQTRSASNLTLAGWSLTVFGMDLASPTRYSLWPCMMHFMQYIITRWPNSYNILYYIIHHASSQTEPRGDTMWVLLDPCQAQSDFCLLGSDKSDPFWPLTLSLAIHFRTVREWARLPLQDGWLRVPPSNDQSVSYCVYFCMCVNS